MQATTREQTSTVCWFLPFASYFHIRPSPCTFQFQNGFPTLNREVSPQTTFTSSKTLNWQAAASQPRLTPPAPLFLYSGALNNSIPHIFPGGRPTTVTTQDAVFIPFPDHQPQNLAACCNPTRLRKMYFLDRPLACVVFIQIEISIGKNNCIRFESSAPPTTV